MLLTDGFVLFNKSIDEVELRLGDAFTGMTYYYNMARGSAVRHSRMSGRGSQSETYQLSDVTENQVIPTYCNILSTIKYTFISVHIFTVYYTSHLKTTARTRGFEVRTRKSMY
jgi:hypothetical protein